MSIIRTFGLLTQEYIEMKVEAFEYMLATEGKDIVVDENEWRQNWKDFGSYDPLINLTLYLMGGKDVCIDCLKAESYSVIHEELDEFLIRKDDPIYLNIDKKSNIYKVLARRFLLAEIEATEIMEAICIGEQFKYTLERGVSAPEVKDATQSLMYKKVQKWARSKTQNHQTLVNRKAKELKQKYPDITKESLSVEVFNKIGKEKPNAGTILKDYLNDYPNF